MGARRPEPDRLRKNHTGSKLVRYQTERLRRRRDFEALMRDRNAARPIRHRILTLRARHNNLEHTRVGYAVGRPVGGAVIRNRIKRQLRALVQELPLAPGYDIVITARPLARKSSSQEIKLALTSSCGKSGLNILENV